MEYCNDNVISSEPIVASCSQYEILAYKLFLAQKLKSILREQERLRKHLLQLDDLEWGLRQHYYTFDDYRTEYLVHRYRGLQYRIRQMKEENRHLQQLTRSQLNQYMFAQSTLNSSAGDGSVWSPVDVQHDENRFCDICALHFLGRRHMRNTKVHEASQTRMECQIEVNNRNGVACEGTDGLAGMDREVRGGTLCVEADYDKARADIKMLIDDHFNSNGNNLSSESSREDDISAGTGEMRGNSGWMTPELCSETQSEGNPEEIQSDAFETALRKNINSIPESSPRDEPRVPDIPERCCSDINADTSPRESSTNSSESSGADFATDRFGESSGISLTPSTSDASTNGVTKLVFSVPAMRYIIKREPNLLENTESPLTKHSDTPENETLDILLMNTANNIYDTSLKEKFSDISVETLMHVSKQMETSPEDSPRGVLHGSRDKFPRSSTQCQIQQPACDVDVLDRSLSEAQSVGDSRKLCWTELMNIRAESSESHLTTSSISDASTHDAPKLIFSTPAMRYIRKNESNTVNHSNYTEQPGTPECELLNTSLVITSNNIATTFLSKLSRDVPDSSLIPISKKAEDSHEEIPHHSPNGSEQNYSRSVYSSSAKECLLKEDNSPTDSSRWAFHPRPDKPNSETNHLSLKESPTHGFEISLGEIFKDVSKEAPSVNFSETSHMLHEDNRPTAIAGDPPVGRCDRSSDDSPKFVYSASSRRYLLQRETNKGGLSSRAMVNSSKVSRDVTHGISVRNPSATKNTFDAGTKEATDESKRTLKDNSTNDAQSKSPRDKPTGSSQESLQFVYCASSKRYILQRETSISDLSDRPLTTCSKQDQVVTSSNNAKVVHIAKKGLKETRIAVPLKTTGGKPSQAFLKTWPGNSTEVSKRDVADASRDNSPRFVYSASSRRYILQKDTNTRDRSDPSSSSTTIGTVGQRRSPRDERVDVALLDTVAGNLNRYESREYYEKWAATASRERNGANPSSRCRVIAKVTSATADSAPGNKSTRNNGSPKRSVIESKQSRIPVKLGEPACTTILEDLKCDDSKRATGRTNVRKLKSQIPVMR